MKTADFGHVPPLHMRAGKGRCDACERDLETGDRCRVFVFGKCVLCGGCHDEMNGPPSGVRVPPRAQPALDGLLSESLKPC